MYTIDIDEQRAKTQEFRINTPIKVADNLCYYIPIEDLKDSSKTFVDGYAKDGNIGFSIIKTIINQIGFSEQNLKHIIEKQLYFCTWSFLTESIKRELVFNIINEYKNEHNINIDIINFKFNFIIINNKNNTNMPKFDVVIMNPPYNVCEKILYETLNTAEKVITVQPTSWILSKDKNKKIINLLKNKSNYTEINIIEGAKYFDAEILGQLSINYIDFTKQNQIKVNNIDGYTSEYNNYDNITQYSIDKLLNEINNHVYKLYKKDNLNNHIAYPLTNDIRIKLQNKNLPIVRINGIRGNVNQKNGKRGDDFYTLFSNNSNEIQNKVLSSTSHIFDTNSKGQKIINCCFVFDNINDRNNFFNYCKTDFCRICLVLIKNNVHNDRGELNYIPWFDFSDEHFSKSPKEIDDWLFKKYGINNKIRQQIEKILPDYYKIR